MTVTSTASRIEFVGNGSLTTFAYPFMIFADADLTVILAGVTQTLTTHYTVTGAGDASGGNVVFVTAPASAAKISILREITAEQTTDYVENDPLPAETLESNLDRVTMLVQQHDEEFARSIKLPKISTKTDIDFPDLGIVANQGKAIRIKSDGTIIETFNVLSTDIAQPITTEGDVIQGGTAGVVERLAVGAAGKILEVVGGKLAYVNKPIRSYLAGLTTSNGTDAVNDIDIAVGIARNNTNDGDLLLAAASGKQIDASWVSGGTPETPLGGLSSSLTLTNDTWYHIHLILVGGAVEVGFDTSVTAANLVTDHTATKFRRIGSVRRGTATNIAFTQLGDEFLWDVPVSDYDAPNPGTAEVLRTLTVPTGVAVWAKHVFYHNDGSPVAVGNGLVTSPDQANTAPSGTIHHTQVDVDFETATVEAVTRTNTSGQIRTRLDASDAGVLLRGTTLGWIDRRGRDD